MTPATDPHGGDEERQTANRSTDERTATRRTVLRATGAGAAGVAIGGFAGTAAASADETPSRLHTDGKWVRDADGEPVRLRGLATASMGFYAVDGIHPKTPEEVVGWASDPARGWYPNVVRLPVTQWDVDQLGVETLVSDVLRPVVDLLGERGIYAMIDYHVIHPYTEAAADDADYDTSPDDIVRNFWGGVAPAFADDEHVVYELFNEPTYPIFWSDNGETVESPEDEWLLWRETAQPWVDTVREEAPETPIVVGSPSWTSRTNFAPEYPFEGENLVYTAHIFPSWDASTWEPYFGDPALEVPMFVDEWGYTDVQRDAVEPHMVGTTDGWGRPFRDWLAGHRNVNWSAWVFSSEWVPTMVNHEWTALGGNDYMGAFVKQWLADARAERTVEDRSTTTPSGPDSPSAQVVSRGPTSATISWEGVTAPGADPIVQYRVSLADREPTILRAGSRSTTVEDLTPTQSYEVSVTAVDASGRRSEPATVTVSRASDTEAVLVIPSTSVAPTIDAAVDDQWEQVQPRSVDQWLWGRDSADVSANWRACWDERALYVLLEVVDDTPVTDLDAAYQNDSGELYLDLDNSRTNDYDGVDDFQLIYPRGSGSVAPGSNSVQRTDPIETATAETGDGWRIETAIPWAPYDVTPSQGHQLGFDVHVVDNAGGDSRDGKRAWFAETDNAWQDPTIFGVVELGDTG